jgi:hypothetical protein
MQKAPGYQSGAFAEPQSKAMDAACETGTNLAQVGNK